MNANPQLKIFGGIAGFLDLYGCSYCIGHGAKTCQYAITQFFYPLTSVLFNDGFLNLPVLV